MNNEPGKPALPIRTLKIIIPENTKVKEVVINSVSYEPMAGKYKIYPAQKPVPVGSKRQFTQPEEKIYSSNDPYPASMIQSAGSKYENGSFNVCYLRLWLAQYLPAEGKVSAVKQVSFTLVLDTGLGIKKIRSRAKNEQDNFEKRIKKQLINPQDLDRYKILPEKIKDRSREKTRDYFYKSAGTQYYSLGVAGTAGAQAAALQAGVSGTLMPPLAAQINPAVTQAGDIDYVIITGDSLTGEFQRLAEWRQKEGITTAIYTVNYIAANYSGDGVATDIQGKIRSFMKDMWRNHGTEYALIGGDVSVVAPRYTTSTVGPTTLPTDYYYCSGLSQYMNGSTPVELCWQLQQAGVYDGITGLNVDCYAPVTSDAQGDPNVLAFFDTNIKLGRAPVDTADEAGVFVDKTISYEKNQFNDYMNRMTAVNMDNYAAGEQWQTDCMEYGFLGTIESGGVAITWNPNIAGYVQLKKLYADRTFKLEDTDTAPVYYADDWCTEYTIKNYFNDFRPNIIAHMGHGWTAGWSTFKFEGSFFAEDAYALNSTGRFAGVDLEVSCDTLAYDTDESVCENLVKAPGGGAITSIGGSRTMYGGVYEPAHAKYLQSLYADGGQFSDYAAGTLFNDGKKLYINNGSIWLNYPGSMERYTAFLMNMIGDPAANIYSNTAVRFNVSCPLSIPANTAQNITVNVSAAGAPVSGAVITLFKVGDGSMTANTDAAGSAAFSSPGWSQGYMYVTARKHNALPFESVIYVGAVPTFTVTPTYTDLPTITFSPTISPTFTNTDTYTPTPIPKLNLQIKASQNSCSANIFDLFPKIANVDNTTSLVSMDVLTIKMWFYTPGSININGCWGGSIKDQTGQYIGNVTGDAYINDYMPACTDTSGRWANKELTVRFSSGLTLAPGQYMDNMELQFNRDNWASPFDDNCDDYSKSGANAYHEDRHFALYMNGQLVREWTSASAMDAETGVEPCAVRLTPASTGTSTNSPTFTVTASVTITATGTRTCTLTRSGTITASYTATFTATGTTGNSATTTASATGTPAPSISGTPTRTPVLSTLTRTATCTATYTVPTSTSTPTRTQTTGTTLTYTRTPAVTPIYSPTRTRTAAGTPTRTRTIAGTPTRTRTYTRTPAPTRTVTTGVIYTYTATQTRTMAVTPAATFVLTPTVTPTSGQAILRVQYYTSNTSTDSNTLYVNARVYNDAASPMDLLPVSVKYWYTFEGAGNIETAELDYAGIQPGGQNIVPYVNRNIQTISQGGQTRVETTSFSSAAGSIPAGGYVELRLRIHKNDWTNYTQTNDYSFGTQTAYQDWVNVTAYISGAKVWGTEPGAVAASAISKTTKTPDDAAFNPGNVYAFPNPASSGVTIRFYTDGTAEVRILVADVNGRKIQEMNINPAGLKAGKNYIRWNLKNQAGADVSNGVYLLYIKSGTALVVKKLAIVR